MTPLYLLTPSMFPKSIQITPAGQDAIGDNAKRAWNSKGAVTGRFTAFAGLLSIMAMMSMGMPRRHAEQVTVTPVTQFAVNKAEVTEHLVKALSFKTISYQDPAKYEAKEFLGLHQHVQQTFLMVHASLTREVIGQYGLLYTWNGLDVSLKPIVLMAHMDVVPAESDGDEEWTYPPFEGTVAEGYIWGRGTLDDKGSMLGILEAVETLLRYGFQPRRSVYLAFGYDEEVFGPNGGEQIATLLHSRGIVPEFVLDEGGTVVRGAAKQIHTAIAVVGIAEKGYLNLELTVQGKGGHSALPPKQTTIGILGRAIANLEKHQMPARVTGPVRESLKSLRPELPFAERMVLANLWLFSPLAVHLMATSPDINAEVRTTTAPTVFNAGIRENVLPSSASALVNFRTLPGDHAERVRAHAIKVIHDPRVTVTVSGHHHEAPGLSSPRSPSFQLISKTVLQIFPGALVVPALVAAATDSRHYSGIADNVYRFNPVELKPEELEGIHGRNERISSENYVRAIQFYIQLIRNAAQ